MAAAGPAASAALRDTKGTLRYMHPNPPPGSGFQVVQGDDSEEYKRTRHEFTEEKVVEFVDARTAIVGGLGAWELDTHGFCVFLPPPPVDFQDRRSTGALKQVYFPQLVEVAKRQTGALDGYIYASGLRDEGKGNANSAYSRFAHSDGGPRSPAMWRWMLAERFQVPEAVSAELDLCTVGIWHPRDRPAYKDPLCLLDVSTLNLEEELRPINYKIPKGRTFSEKSLKNYLGYASVDWERMVPVSNLTGPTYAPNHRWVFISDQRPDEAWMFKQWDTREGVAKICFHNSFHDPFYDLSDPKKPGRRSAEFQVLLTFPKKKTTAPSKL